MKHWDHAVPAVGVDLGVWMDAQADPEIVAVDSDVLVVDLRCWEPRSRGDIAGPDEAPYRGRLRFAGVQAFRAMNGEMGPYHFVRGNFDNPECLFEVRVHDHDPSRWIARQAPQIPSVMRVHDPNGWFLQLDSWNPAQGAPPARPPGTRHYVVVGHDSYVEVLASGYEFERVPPVNSGTLKS